MRNRDLRAAPRVKADLPCMVYPGTQTSGRFAKGLIVDLSTAGAAIRLNEHLNFFQDEVRVVFRLSIVDDEVLVEARARAVRKPDEGDAPFMGVAFSSLALSERLALQAYVQSTLVHELEDPALRGREASLVYAIRCADRTCTLGGTRTASRLVSRSIFGRPGD